MSYRCERCNSPRHTLDNCPHNEPKKYTEAELQVKLRQQREACADAYVEHDEGYVHVVDAIMNALTGTINEK